MSCRVAVNVEQLMLPSPGGVGRYTAKLVANLAALGVDLRPVVARHTPEEIKSAWAEFGLSSVPEPAVLPLPRAALYDSWHVLDWPPLSRDREVQVFHAPSLAVPPKAGKRLVVSVHDAAPWLFPETFPLRGRWFHHAGMRAAARRADIILTGTNAAADELLAHTRLPAERLRVIPYGVDHPYVEPDPEDVWAALQRHNLVDRQFVLWVGSLEPRKGLGTLVAAAATLARRGAAPTLVLAGYAGWRNSKVISPDDRAVLGPALREVGRLPQPELNALYASATLFAFPSLHEGFGLPVLEAMAAGARSWPRTSPPFARWPVTRPSSSRRPTRGRGQRRYPRSWRARRSRPTWPGRGAGGQRCSRGRKRPRRRLGFTKNSCADSARPSQARLQRRETGATGTPLRGAAFYGQNMVLR